MERDHVDFHIATNDYFGTLATVLDLVIQDLKADRPHTDVAHVLARKRDELMYLQKHCRIEKQG